MPAGVYKRTKPRQRKLLTTRFFSKVKASESNGCLEWQGATTRGYGVFWGKDRLVLAHCWLFEMINGAVPDGFELDHLCRNRCCVNPTHLEIVTRKENCRRGDVGIRMREKTHCPQGHPYDNENTYICLTTNGTPQRLCRSCRRGHRDAMLAELEWE